MLTQTCHVAYQFMRRDKKNTMRPCPCQFQSSVISKRLLCTAGTTQDDLYEVHRPKFVPELSAIAQYHSIHDKITELDASRRDFVFLPLPYTNGEVTTLT